MHQKQQILNNLEQSLFEAIANNDLNTVKECFQQEANIEAKDKYDTTPLMFAILKNNTEMVKLLIEKGADIEATDTFGLTPLMWAVEENNINIVKYLIEKGADINTKNKYNDTPLILALEKANKNIIKLLLTGGVKEFEVAFMKIILDQDSHDLRDIFIDYALQINHRYSKFIKDLNNKDITIDLCKEFFYQAKEVKKACKDDLIINKLVQSMFLKAGKELVSAIAKDTPQDQHKDL